MTEHREWCATGKFYPEGDHPGCTCERREGERRKPWTPDRTREWERGPDRRKRDD